MSLVREPRKKGSASRAFYGERKVITKEDRQDAARFADIVLLGYQLPSRKHALPLANALSRNKFVRHVEIRDSNLTSMALQAIAISLADAPHLTYINLSANNLDRGLKDGTGDDGSVSFAQDLNGVTSLAEVVSVQRLVCYLNLSKNGLDWNTAKILSEHVIEHPALEEIDLSLNKLSSKGAVYLSKLIKGNSHLRRLHLGSNNIGSLGLDLLCRALRVNKGLVELDLRNNNLDDDSIRTLTDTLRIGARGLIKLNLSYNRIGPEGAVALSFALKTKNLTLRHLSLDFNPLTAGGTNYTGLLALGSLM